MDNPLAKYVKPEWILGLLLLFFGYFIVTYVATYAGISEGMTGGDAIDGAPQTVAEVYNY
jgi:hypothetical protein